MLLVPWSCCACAILVQSGPPGAPQGDLVKKIKNPILCLRDLIMVFFCKIHDLVVHCASGSVKMPWGPIRGHSLKSPPSALFTTKNGVRRNRTQEKSYPREIVPNLNGYDFSGEIVPWVRFHQRYRTKGTISPEISYPIFTILL